MKIRAASAIAISATLLITIACQSEGTGPSTPAQPTGTLLAFHPAQIVYTVNAETGQTVEIARNGNPVYGWVTGALGPRAKFVSSASFGPRELRLLELATGMVVTIHELPSTVGVGSTRISPDGKRLAFSAAGWVPQRHALMITDLTTRSTAIRWVAPEDDPNVEFGHLRWLPDHSGFVALSERPTTATISIFDLETGEVEFLTEPMTHNVYVTLDLSPDGHTIVYNTPDGELKFITRSGEPAEGFPTDLEGLLPAFSPDGRMMAWSKHLPGTTTIDGIWFYRFSDGEMWRAMPEGSPITWLLDWE